MGFPQTAAEIKGYGIDYQWMRLGPWKQGLAFAQALKNAKLNCTGVELFGYCPDRLYEKPDEMVRRLADFVRVMSANAIATKVTVVNWNWGAGGINQGRTPCDAYFTDDWFNRVLNGIMQIPAAQEVVWLEPVCEWGPSQRNKECWKKAERWCNIAAQRWGGRLLWNYQSRPASTPGGKWSLDYHTFKSVNCGPRGAVTVTDTGTVLAELCGPKWCTGANIQNFKALGNLVKLCRAKGNGFLMYHFNAPDGVPQVDAINAIGAA